MAMLTSRLWKNMLRPFLIWLGATGRALWVFIVPAVVLLLTIVAFWHLDQGKDLLIAVGDDHRKALFTAFATVFMAYVTWYIARVQANANWVALRGRPGIEVHTPRLLGTLVFTVVALAFFGTWASAWLPGAWVLWLLLLLSAGLYYPWCVRIARRIRAAVPGDDEKSRKLMFKLTYLLVGVTLALVMVNFFCTHALVAILCALLGQFVHTTYVVNRQHFQKRYIDERDTLSATRGGAEPQTSNLVERVVKGAVTDYKELEAGLFSRMDRRPSKYKREKPLGSYRVFNGFTLAGILVFVAMCFSVSFALLAGGAAVALFGLTICTVLYGFTSAFGRAFRFNAVLLMLLMAMVLGSFIETHRVELLDRSDDAPTPSQRMTAKEYLRAWIGLRRDSIVASSTYPVYFVLADGGASRSGYWVASVLGELHDRTSGKFADHLFCLSGASGGSWGNAAYYTWLKLARDRVAARSTASGRMEPYAFAGDRVSNGSKEILQRDFLSYTLAHMLGNDNLGLLFPPFGLLWGDRARALEKSLEHAGSEMGQPTMFSRGFGAYMTNVDDPNSARMPALLLNVTRMQDAKPGVIGTIMLDEGLSGHREDLLCQLPFGKDLPTSTAIAMGSRFPYVSPAGYINTNEGDEYFVDGGYFDNSGAGATHELLLTIRKAILDGDVDSLVASKLRFHVIHISNSEQTPGELHQVSTAVNDLLSPILTIASAYGMQTDVNDARLRYYVENVMEPSGEYTDVNLYKPLDEGPDQPYSMNWVISNTTLARMDQRCANHPSIPGLLEEIRRPCTDQHEH